MSNKIVKFEKNFANYVKGDIAGFEAGDPIMERALEIGSAVAYKAKEEKVEKTAEEIQADKDAKAKAIADAKAEKDAKK